MSALALLDHHRHEGLDAVDDAHQVDAETPVPVGLGRLPQRSAAAARDSGVVADDVDRAVLAQLHGLECEAGPG